MEIWNLKYSVVHCCITALEVLVLTRDCFGEDESSEREFCRFYFFWNKTLLNEMASFEHMVHFTIKL